MNNHCIFMTDILPYYNIKSNNELRQLFSEKEKI